MKVMVIVKATPGSEEGKMPTEELMAAMGNFNEELVKAGIMESGDGLRPSREGVRVHFRGKDRSVTSGPFIETHELVAGYWVWNVASMEEAIDWVKKCPNPMEDEESDIEIRPFYELEDFAEADASGEFLEKERALRSELAMGKASLNNYLFFPGCCEEALEFYKTHLAAKPGFMLRYRESPEPLPENMVPQGYENKIMHCEFTIGNARIFACDDGCFAVSSTFGGFSLALTVPAEEEARRVFSALSEGGEVKMPLMETFWSPLYGQVVDKFGVAWMVMLPGADAAN